MLKIIDGVIQGNDINGIKFVRSLVPLTNGFIRMQNRMAHPTSITIHNTANAHARADAAMHARYLDTITKYVSWHLTVDDKSIYQHIPLNENTWHATDGINGPGNRTSVSIEVCEHAGIDWPKARAIAAMLAMELKETIDTIEMIVPHKHWKSTTYPNGKDCPHIILKEGFDKFNEYALSGKAKIDLTPIIGEAAISKHQAVEFLKLKNPNPKIAISIEELIDIFIEESRFEGVRWDLAFCQSCHETGFFNYGGIVLPEMNNYSGLGAVNGSEPGTGGWFASPELGVRAQIQHLVGYATDRDPVKVNVDPRWQPLIDAGFRGKAPLWLDLGGKWAWPGYDRSRFGSLDAAKINRASYGQTILDILEQIKHIEDIVITENEKLLLERIEDLEYRNGELEKVLILKEAMIVNQSDMIQSYEKVFREIQTEIENILKK